MESEMMCNASHLPSPVTLEISHHPLTMRRMVNLVIAMERIKSSVAQSFLSPDFRDQDFLSIMLESLVEERFVSELLAAQPEQKFTLVPEVGPQCYSVEDMQKRDLVLVTESMKLHAVMLQAGSSSYKVNLNMLRYRPPVPSTEQPVALGIRGTQYYLSCYMDGEEASLHVETVSNTDLLSSISENSDMARFIFYKHVTGQNVTTLRSARFPEWYISTKEEDNEAVYMCKEASSSSTFTIQPVS
ncbi:unnamed protein product [Knipowitschia caucasica]